MTVWLGTYGRFWRERRGVEPGRRPRRDVLHRKLHAKKTQEIHVASSMPILVNNTPTHHAFPRFRHPQNPANTVMTFEGSLLVEVGA